MSEVYQQRKDPDGFLYITYTDESTLGWSFQINWCVLNHMKKEMKLSRNLLKIADYTFSVLFLTY